MKKFYLKKVGEIAIDLPHHQQIYVLDRLHRDSVIEVLSEMGFTSDDESLSQRYAHLPWVINVKEKRFFSVGSAGIMACAVQKGAKVLNLKQMIELMNDDI